MTRIKGWSRETDFRNRNPLSAQDVALKLWLKLPAAFAQQPLRFVAVAGLRNSEMEISNYFNNCPSADIAQRTPAPTSLRRSLARVPNVLQTRITGDCRWGLPHASTWANPRSRVTSYHAKDFASVATPRKTKSCDVSGQISVRAILTRSHFFDAIETVLQRSNGDH
jgi:hypothetical protein